MKFLATECTTYSIARCRFLCVSIPTRRIHWPPICRTSTLRRAGRIYRRCNPSWMKHSNIQLVRLETFEQLAVQRAYKLRPTKEESDYVRT